MSAPFRIRRRGVGVVKTARGSGEDFDGYQKRLIKMIPAEVVGLYLVGSGFIPEGHQRYVLPAWSIFCLIAVVVVRVRGTSDRKKRQKPQWRAVIISSVAFVIWLYLLGGPFELFSWHFQYVGSLLVLVWTFIAPFLYEGTLE